MANNILKINNTIINNLIITTINAYRLLVSNNSNIKKSSFYMTFDEYDISFADNSLIYNNYSSLNIDTFNIEDINLLTEYSVYSENHSDVYIETMNGLSNASPAWIDKLETDITFSNNISYNIYASGG